MPKEIKEQTKEIEHLYAIFADFDFSPFSNKQLVFTEDGAEKLLDKINEIINRLNNLTPKN